MVHYILKRMLLMIPTLFFILLINFTIVQIAPGGPVEQALHQAQSDLGIGRALSAETYYQGWTRNGAYLTDKSKYGLPLYVKHNYSEEYVLTQKAARKTINSDLILLDINMPVMNGWDFLDLYAGIESGLPKKICIN